jgi:hypothetical protein
MRRVVLQKLAGEPASNAFASGIGFAVPRQFHIANHVIARIFYRLMRMSCRGGPFNELAII